MRVMDRAAPPDAVPPPASGEGEHLSLALANSVVTLPGGHTADLLDTPARTNHWLTRHGLAPADIGMREMCTDQLRALRGQVRSLFAAHVAGHPAAPAAVAAVNEALTRVPTARLLHWDPATGPYRVPPHPTTEIVGHALALVAADAADLLTAPGAERLTACRSTPCDRFLVRHGRRHWCSTRCGDRARAARAYTRRAGSR